MVLRFKLIGLVISIMILGTIDSYSQKNKFVPEYSTMISSNKGADMLRQCSRAVPQKVSDYFDLTINDIQGLENNYIKVLEIKSTGCCYSGIKLQGLEKYVFQYIGVIIDGKKYIYVNAFLIDSKDDLERFYKDWKTCPVIMCDGGESVWGVLFNLKNKKFSQLSINGVA